MPPKANMTVIEVTISPRKAISPGLHRWIDLLIITIPSFTHSNPITHTDALKKDKHEI
jgi:hypothetical protein